MVTLQSMTYLSILGPHADQNYHAHSKTHYVYGLKFLRILLTFYVSQQSNCNHLKITLKQIKYFSTPQLIQNMATFYGQALFKQIVIVPKMIQLSSQSQ